MKLQYLATSCKQLTHWKKLWCWEGLGAGREGDDWGWDGWMASRTRWTWVWVNSRRWWWTGRPGMLRFMGSQRVRHNWVTELNWCSIALYNIALYFHQKSQVLFLLWLSSFFLELFLHWYPITYWAPTHLGSSSFGVLPFCLVILFMGFKERNIEVVCHSLF